MQIGIFGSADDPQCKAVAREAKALGADNVLIPSQALSRGDGFSFLDDQVLYRGVSLDALRAFYLRQIPAPYAPAMEQDSRLVLYEDWFNQYMQSRERASFYVSWLLNLQYDGKLIINAPHAASVLQYKPYQLHALRRLGAEVPRTLISNDPAEVARFREAVKDVIFKPLMGGALTRPLDDEAMERLEAIRTAPVIFQERVGGDDLRVMLVGDEIVSSVAIVTPEQHLDFRGDPVYSGGEASYREVVLPEAVQNFCRKAARACGLEFAGIDIKHDGDRWVFLELNSSPIYLDVESKLGHPISAALARRLVKAAQGRPE